MFLCDVWDLNCAFGHWEITILLVLVGMAVVRLT